MLAALCVAAGGCAPLITCAARRGVSAARSGRESRPAGRTGKLDLRCHRQREAVALRVEGDGCDRRPIAGWPAPASRVLLAGVLINRVACRQQPMIAAGMTLRGGDVADGTVPAFVVVPVGEAHRPLSRGIEIGEPLERERRAILGGAEQRLEG